VENLFENWRRYLNEDQLIKEEKITKYIVESKVDHLWENNNFDELNEESKDWLRDTAHTILDVLGVAGDVVTPGAGAIFDGINMIWYLKRKCWLYAAFSALSLLPYLGDALGKGGKMLAYLRKGTKAIKALKSKIKKHESKIDKLFDKLESDEKSPEIARKNSGKMKDALKVFVEDKVHDRPTC
jgi:hypothetical protein